MKRDCPECGPEHFRRIVCGQVADPETLERAGHGRGGARWITDLRKHGDAPMLPAGWTEIAFNLLAFGVAPEYLTEQLQTAIALHTSQIDGEGRPSSAELQ